VADVLERESTDLVVCDDEFRATVTAATDLPVVVAWHEQPVDALTVAALIARADNSTPPKPPRAARVVLLTSGTSGTPKGAERGGGSGGIGSVAGFFDRIPLRPHAVTVIGAPMCHAWGYAGLTLGASCASTLVMRRRFDALQTITDVERHRASVLWLAPVMLERIMALAPEVRTNLDLTSLRVTALSGSAVRSGAVTAFMDEVGDIVYNNYSSTEVGWAAIATPDDLRQAPGTAGRPPKGTRLQILDDNAQSVTTGQTGRIFVHNDNLFDGYTGGGGKEIHNGFMATGDVGHLDVVGRLFIDGRDDEMIVSGGENVYPVEVEALLGEHPAVAETAVVGVPDDDFGQRLVAFVVLRPQIDADCIDAELRAFVRDNLARHKVPRSFELLDELPRNASGKILKRQLCVLATKKSL
jgi:acyl-CoA synthetase (AMP-forming)/AMP-acid ligase II